MNKIFKKDKYELEFRIFGHGDKTLVVFHGFGQDLFIADLMIPLYDKYTILSVNLFYHFSDDKVKPQINIDEISTNDFISLYEGLINDVFPGCGNISILGYSIGGRLGSVFAGKTTYIVDELFLIAPDGYQFSFFYWFVTYSKVGLSLYYFVMEHIYHFKEFARFLKNNKILPVSLYKFFLISIGLKRNRYIAPKVWLVYKRLNVDVKEMKIKFFSDNTVTKVYLGLYDPVIKSKKVTSKISSLNPYFFYLKKGHALLSKSFFKNNFKKD